MRSAVAGIIVAVIQSQMIVFSVKFLLIIVNNVLYFFIFVLNHLKANARVFSYREIVQIFLERLLPQLVDHAERIVPGQERGQKIVLRIGGDPDRRGKQQGYILLIQLDHLGPVVQQVGLTAEYVRMKGKVLLREKERAVMQDAFAAEHCAAEFFDHAFIVAVAAGDPRVEQLEEFFLLLRVSAHG